MLANAEQDARRTAPGHGKCFERDCQNASIPKKSKLVEQADAIKSKVRDVATKFGRITSLRYD